MIPASKSTTSTNRYATAQPNTAGSAELEAAWLWFAAQATSSKARQYCLEQALLANPESRAAREALAQLRQTPPASQENGHASALKRFAFGWKRSAVPGS